MVLAAAQRCRPASVLGPVLRPPCVLHTRLPLMAGAAHCSFVRLDLAWQRWQVTRPPSVLSVCSKCKVLCGTNYTCCRAEGEGTKSLHSGPFERLCRACRTCHHFSKKLYMYLFLVYFPKTHGKRGKEVSPPQIHWVCACHEMWHVMVNVASSDSQIPSSSESIDSALSESTLSQSIRQLSATSNSRFPISILGKT